MTYPSLACNSIMLDKYLIIFDIIGFISEVLICVFGPTSCSDTGEYGVTSMVWVFLVLLSANVIVGYMFYFEKIQRQMYEIPTNYKTVLNRSCSLLVFLFATLIVVLSVISIFAVLSS